MILLIAPHNCTLTHRHSINPQVKVLREHAVLYLLFIDFPKACLSAREEFETKSIVKTKWNTLKEGLHHNENKISLKVWELKKGWTSIAFSSD